MASWMNSAALTWGPLAAVLTVFLGALAIFAMQTARHGLVQTERAMKLGGSAVLGRFFVEYGLWMFRPVVRVAVRLGVHPDHLSWASLWLHVIAAVALAYGGFGLAGWVLLFGAMCDSLDGGVARARHLASDAGEVLDAVDRSLGGNGCVLRLRLVLPQRPTGLRGGVRRLRRRGDGELHACER